MAHSKKLEDELRSWRYTLENKPLVASNVIYQIAKKIENSQQSDPHSSNWSLSRLEQGVETPQDYGFNF